MTTKTILPATRMSLAIIAKVLGTTREVLKSAGPQLEAAIRTVANISTREIKEFLVALPIFLTFVHQLLRERDKVDAQKRLLILGAAGAMSTLGLVVLGTLLSSLPFQVMLLVTHPFLGMALLVSESLILSTIMILMVWLIIHVLNRVLIAEPVYQRICKEYLPTEAQIMLDNVENGIRLSGVDISKVGDFGLDALTERGRSVNPEKTEKRLARTAKKTRKKVSRSK